VLKAAIVLACVLGLVPGHGAIIKPRSRNAIDFDQPMKRGKPAEAADHDAEDDMPGPKLGATDKKNAFFISSARRLKKKAFDKIR
jgi:hypothetical protein